MKKAPYLGGNYSQLKNRDMGSENYRILLNNERFSSEMTAEDYDNTLMHFAKLYHQEQLEAINPCCDRLENFSGHELNLNKCFNCGKKIHAS